ncbi:hypothetical protein [Microbacterium sp. CR_7]|uniref:hypothetical protein n=1 Tax=Microbacterium sp. CR_7 TaxID=3055792 RepID=UPI0035BFBFCE
MLRIAVVGLSAVRIEHGDDRVREIRQVIGSRHRPRRAGRAVGASELASALIGFSAGLDVGAARTRTSRLREAFVGTRSLVDGEALPRLLHRRGRREHPRDPDPSGEQSISERRPSRRHPLSGQQIDVASHEVDDPAEPCRGGRLDGESALQQLVLRAAPGEVRQVDGVSGGERLDDDRLSAPHDRTRRRDDRDALLVGYSGERVVAERTIEVGDDLIEEFAGAG